MLQKLYGGIELGGTKTICAVGNENGNLLAQTVIPTTSVNETFAAIFNFFEQNESFETLGVGSFGPVQLNPSHENYGAIYNSPKKGWEAVNVKGLLEARLKVTVVVETDVNCAALGEQYYGLAQKVHSFSYLTLGTGIGGGLVQDDKLIHGILNLEMGHMRLPHEPFTSAFEGACTYHRDCFEGIASGYAMAQRYGKPAEQIDDIRAWELEASYIAAAVNNLMMTIGPELIILGGGLINHNGLLAAIRTRVGQNINNYLDFPDLETYLVRSSGTSNGVQGAIKLAALLDT